MAKGGAGKAIVQTAEYFVSHTSIRGLPRILKTDDKILRVTWTIFTLASFVTLTYFITILYVEYTNYATTTQIRQIPPHTGDFPVVSFCYDMPLFNHFATFNHPTEFSRRIVSSVLRLANHVTNKTVKKTISIEELQRLNSAAHFIETNYENMMHLELPPIEDIVSCTYNTDGSIHLCDIEQFPNAHSGRHIDTEFFHCFSAKVPKNKANPYTTMALTMNFSVHHQHWIKKDAWFKADIATHLFGYGETIQFLLHSENEPPLVKTYGTRILLNNLVQVSYKKTIKKHKSVPINICLTNPKYSKAQCRLDLSNNILEKECGCLGDVLLTKKFYNFTKTPICGNMTDIWSNFEKLSQRIACRKRAKQLYRKSYKTECPRACGFEYYEVDKIFTMPFKLENAKNVQGHLNQASGVQDIFDQLSTPDGTTALIPTKKRLNLKKRRRRQAVKKPRNIKLKVDHASLKAKLQQMLDCPHVNPSDGTCSKRPIKLPKKFQGFRNVTHTRSLLMQITKVPGNHDTLSQETLVITVERLLSQIGGLCSIFVGLTFTVIAEVVEILYLTCCSTINSVRGNSKSDEEHSNNTSSQKVQVKLTVNPYDEKLERISGDSYGTTYNEYNEDARVTKL